MTMRRARGFTLVELMVVVAIVALVAGVAARMYSRGSRGEAAPSFARSLMSVVLEARHQALTLGRTTRVTLAPPAAGKAAMTVATAVWDGTQWAPQNTLSVPTAVQLCNPDKTVVLGATASPSCPLGSGVANTVCFMPNGRVRLVDEATGCPTTSQSGYTGATLYVTSTTATDNKKFKVVIWGLTGMPKLMDTW
jgi:type IV fimbrial biogenesis protein FimT